MTNWKVLKYVIYAIWSYDILLHSRDRTCEGSGSAPPGRQCRRTENLRLLSPAFLGYESESCRTIQRLTRSGALTPGSEDWLATNIQKLRISSLWFWYIQSQIIHPVDMLQPSNYNSSIRHPKGLRYKVHYISSITSPQAATAKDIRHYFPIEADQRMKQTS